MIIYLFGFLRGTLAVSVERFSGFFYYLKTVMIITQRM